MSTPEPLFYDAMNLLYRSYHGNEKLTNSAGAPTGAIYSFIRTVLGLQKKYKNSTPVFVFDAFPESALFGDSTPDNKFAPPLLEDVSSRKSIYSDYKSNRSHMPEDLTKQCWPLAFILHGLGYPVIIASGGVEGDDILGSLATQAKARGQMVRVASGDKDLLALISDNCIVYNFNDKKEYDAAQLMEKLGVKPEQVADYLALMGDAVDNIPGVEKCGTKTAAKWLAKYGTLQGVIDNAAEITGVVGENLRAALPTLPRNLVLTTLKTDLPLSYESCTTGPTPNYDLVKNIFDNLEIRSFNSLIPSTSVAPTP